MTRRQASLLTVAERAGVSVATASRVLNPGSHAVAETTRRKVLDAADALDFVPNMMARGLAAGTTSTLGVIVHDMTDQYFALIARGVADVADQHGLSVFICNSDGDPAKELDYVRKLRALRVGGVIFAASGFVDEAHDRQVRAQARTLVASGAAVVRLGSQLTSKPDVACATADGFVLAAEHLASLGHRSVGLLEGPPQLVSTRERSRDARAGLRVAGLKLVAAADGQNRLLAGRQAAADLLAAHPEITALVSTNDQMAIGALHGLYGGGQRAPEDLSVIGFGDIPLAEHVEQPLTTVHLPLRELGSAAAELVLARLAGAKPRKTAKPLPVSLAVRATTGPPRRP